MTTETYHVDRRRATEVHRGGTAMFMAQTTVEERDALYKVAQQEQGAILFGSPQQDTMRANDLATDALRLRRMRRADMLYVDMIKEATREVVAGSEDAAALWRYCYARMRADELENGLPSGD